MGMLTGRKIFEEIKAGNIEIDPFDSSRINPNSYNLRLDSHIKVYEPEKTAAYKRVESPLTMDNDSWYVYDREGNYHPLYLDLDEKDETTDLYIDKDKGLILYPNKLYLGTTIERTFTDKYVPLLDGRSSVGRKGVMVHVTAGFGDIGFNGKWTLEIIVAHPTMVHYGSEICQISFHTPEGSTDYKYNGRYQGQSDVVESKSEEKKKGMFVE